MPCPTCDSEFVYIGDWPGSPKCPKCDGIAIVNRDLAIEISTKRLAYLDQLFMRYMKKFNKELLIAHIAWEREKFSRAFFDQYQPFDMAKFVSYSFLIRRLMAENGFSGTMQATEKTTKQLIETFTEYLGHRVGHIYLEDGLGVLMARAPFEPEKLTPEYMLSNFVLIYTERFLPIHETFANNEIYDDAAGKRKFEEYAKEREELIKNPPSQRGKYSPEELIRQSYPILSTLYCGLLKNEIYAAQTFAFSNYQKASIIPSKLMEVTNAFTMYTDRPTVIDGALFRVALDKVFDGNLAEIEKTLVFSESNQQTFPLFVELNDRILVPHRTAYIVFLLLHPLMHKDIFNAETENRSKEMEGVKAKLAFESAKFDYLPHLTDKKNATLEIDGIATRGRTMCVVEVKGWGIGTYFEHKERQEWLIRDLQGIVDGYKYSTIDGITRSESIVSLTTKVQFVKENMGKWGFRSRDYDVVKGIIVMKDYPPIDTYKDVMIISLQKVGEIP
jgi:hypothetical protein